MTRTNDPQGNRARLLRAATDLLGSQGLAALTLDEVARVAGSSKGGLLHHFPNKQALLIGIVQERIDAFTTLLQTMLADEPAAVRGRWARAYVRASFAAEADVFSANGALVLSVLADPALLVYFNQAICFAPPDDDGLPPGRLALIRMTCDGMWITELTDKPFAPAVRTAMQDELLRLTR